ncbi:hypothetical protein ACVWZ4_000699 [Bradyrhizobium sp. USDA 4472]
MNRPLSPSHQFTALPVEFEALAPPPLLLPGESLEHYELLRQTIFADLAPRSAIEWLLAIDVAELSWEIQRYRVLRHKLLAYDGSTWLESSPNAKPRPNAIRCKTPSVGGLTRSPRQK